MEQQQVTGPDQERQRSSLMLEADEALQQAIQPRFGGESTIERKEGDKEDDQIPTGDLANAQLRESGDDF